MGNGLSGQLIDRFGRCIDYLRLSVTDRCDLRCSYCLPERFKGFEEPADWLNFEEIVRIVGLFAAHGVGRVRLTGGEPLLRRELAGLAGRLSALPGVRDLSLSTNATQLAGQARASRQAGVSRLNVSLDSLRRERSRAMELSGLNRPTTTLIEMGRNALTYAGHTIGNRTAERVDGSHVGGTKWRSKSEWHVNRNTMKGLRINADNVEKAIVEKVMGDLHPEHRSGDGAFAAAQRGRGA